GMQRLSALEHDVVGGVDHRADQPHPGAAEPEPEPERRSYRPDPPHQPGIVPRAEIRRVDPHAELAGRRFAGLARPRAPPTTPAGSAVATSTRQTWRRSAPACGSTASKRPTRMRGSRRPTSAMSSTGKPAMVRRSASWVAVPLHETKSPSQDSGTRMGGGYEGYWPRKRRSFSKKSRRSSRSWRRRARRSMPMPNAKPRTTSGS